MHCLKYFFTLASLMLFSQLSMANERDFWLVDEFIEMNPAQEPISQSFSELVRKPAIPLSVPPLKPVKIAVVYPANQISDYWLRSIRSFEARLKELDIPYEIQSFLTQTTNNNSLNEQAKEILTAVNSGADYLILTLYKKQHKSIIERLISDKKTKVILQNITTPIKDWDNQQPFLYVGFDHVKGTQLLSNWYQDQKLHSNEYGLLHFPKGYISQVRGDSFAQYTGVNSDYKLVSSYYTDSTRKNSYSNAINLLEEHNNLGFIYASSTDIALGVSDAISEKGLQNKVLVNGWGGGSAELAAIEKGKLDVTVMRMNDDNGVAMAEAIKLDLGGNEEKVPVIYSGDYVVVTKESSPAKIQSLKQQAFRYSGVDDK
ncbi:ABC transporter substrate-binding protein [Marinomonas sp. SBI22]|uniref:substrate-binding domain-containing protein n=1 Tax=unclassified Marinomonas TaxID=196814 RepID=UPI0007AF4999|nr:MULTISPECIES: substrate-binding domain-containing protein [unclassified Marinomonas]KZM42990.1 ABC transporter substrate-binding protein [Marinomonas sp. SBI22]KZM44560.1 ABC transporter substrate-binding protein [Marinomonas sp. SBI8L]